jgi:hypothetical protein
MREATLRLRADKLIEVDREEIVDSRLRQYCRLTSVEWLWMAWASGRGRPWARVVFASFLTLMSLLTGLFQHAARYASADLLAGSALALVALVTVVLIFHAVPAQPTCGRRVR